MITVEEKRAPLWWGVTTPTPALACWQELSGLSEKLILQKYLGTFMNKNKLCVSSTRAIKLVAAGSSPQSWHRY